MPHVTDSSYFSQSPAARRRRSLLTILNGVFGNGRGEKMHAVSRGPAPATFRFALFPFSPATVLFSPAVNHSCPLSLWPLSGCLLRREAISPSPPPLSSFHSGEQPPPPYYRIACAEREPFSVPSSPLLSPRPPPPRIKIFRRRFAIRFFPVGFSSSLVLLRLPHAGRSTRARGRHNATPAPPLPSFVTSHTRGSWVCFVF